MFKKYILVIGALIASITLFIQPAQAGKVTQIYSEMGGDAARFFFLVEGASYCSKTTTSQRLLNRFSMLNNDKRVAMVLTAFASGKNVTVFSSPDCSYDGDSPVVVLVVDA
jgi:hypothetical protein